MPLLSEARPHKIPQGARSATARIQLSDAPSDLGLDEQRIAAERMARENAQAAYYKEYAIVRWPSVTVIAVHDEHGVSATVYELVDTPSIRSSADRKFDSAISNLEGAWNETGFPPPEIQARGL